MNNVKTSVKNIFNFPLSIYIIKNDTIVLSSIIWPKYYYIKIYTEGESFDFGLWDIVMNVSYKKSLKLIRSHDNTKLLIYNLNRHETNNVVFEIIKEIKSRTLSFETKESFFWNSIKDDFLQIPWIIPQ